MINPIFKPFNEFPAGRQAGIKLMLLSEAKSRSVSGRLFIRIPFLVVAFFLTVSSLKAQKLLTLEEAIATALQHNYDIILSKNDSAVAALDYSYRNAVFLPRINANSAIVWNSNYQQLKFVKRAGTGDSVVNREGVRSNNLNNSLALNWTLFDGFKMFATRDKAAEFVTLGELAIKNQVVNTVASVINNYYNIVRQKQQLKAVEEQMQLSNERVTLAQRRLEIGVGAKPDVLQSQVDLNAQKAAQLAQQTLIAQLKEQLNQLMNVALQTGYEVLDTIPIKEYIALGDIQTDIENTNPALLIAKKNIDIANLTVKERKAERFPIVSFNTNYNLNRNDNKVAVNLFQPFYTLNRGLNYGFATTIPILNGFNNRRLIRQAQLNVQYQQVLYENQRSLIYLNVINAFKDYDQQKKALTLEEANILLAKENVDIIFQTFKLGAATFLQLREAQKSLEDAYNRLIAARYNTKVAETELLRLKGDLVR